MLYRCLLDNEVYPLYLQRIVANRRMGFQPDISNIIKACPIDSVRDYTDGGSDREGLPKSGYGETSLNASTSIAASEGFRFCREEVQPASSTQIGPPQFPITVAEAPQAKPLGQSASAAQRALQRVFESQTPTPVGLPGRWSQ
jgi:hypothetical protein